MPSLPRHALPERVVRGSVFSESQRFRSAQTNIEMDVFVKDGEEYKPLSEDYTVLEKSELETSYYTEDEVKAAKREAVKKRFSNHVNLDEAHENETVVARVLEQHGGQSEGPDEDELRSRWETAHLKPERTKREEAEERAKVLEAKVKHQKMADLLTSEDVGFSKAFVKRPEPGKPSPSEVYVGDRFTLDDNASLTPSGDTKLSADDVAKELAANPAYADFLAPESKNGSRAGRPNQDNDSAPKGKTVRRRDLDSDDKIRQYINKYGSVIPKVEGVPPYTKLPL